ncbi:MAG: hypothetical protein P8Y47_08110, partial [Alphaproteobacteria bacterium]
SMYGSWPALTDSNKWYVLYNNNDQNGIVILGVSHGVLRWNCEPCSAFTSELNWDERASLCALIL